MTPTPEHMAVELASQPETWARAAGMHAEHAILPASGAKVAIVGCGTSWFMAQAYAALRETGGHGVTDAFAASEAFVDRDYDAIIALTRSGTTSEVRELVGAQRGRTRIIGIVGDTASPFVDEVDDLIALPFADEQSVVQTRFATTALAFLRASLGEDLTRRLTTPGSPSPTSSTTTSSRPSRSPSSVAAGPSASHTRPR